MAKVDCTSVSSSHVFSDFCCPAFTHLETKKEKALNTRFGVKSFPSFFLVDGWSVYEFDKPRSEANLMDFARGGYKKQDVSFDLLNSMV